MNFYGKLIQIECNNHVDLYVKEIRNDGFTIIENVLTEEELKHYREKIDFLYNQQETDFGVDTLNSIKEKNMCRMPLKYDDYFINIAKTIFPYTNLDKHIKNYIDDFSNESKVISSKKAKIIFENIRMD